MPQEEHTASGTNGPSQQQIDDLLRQFSQGQFEPVIEQARTLAERFPESFALWNILGAGYGALRRHGEAEAAFRKSVDLNPTSYAAHRNLGGACQQQGKFDQAIEAFGIARAINPDQAEAHFNLARAYQQAGNLDGAVRAFDDFLAIRPEHIETHIVVGNLLRLRGKTDGAVAAYEKAIALRPDCAEAHGQLGAVLRDQGDLQGAADAYRKVLSINPDDAGTHNNLGVVLKEQGKLQEAVAACAKALSLQPGFAEAHINLGNALQGQENWQKAVEAYRKALSLKPDNAGAYYNMGMALKRQGKLDQAIEYYRMALSLKPDDAQACYRMGLVFRELGKLDQAIDAFAKAISARPDYAEAFNNLGMARHDGGDLGGAVEAYRKALSLKTAYPEANNNLGVALNNQGKPEEAIEAYRAALSLRPDYADAHYNLAFVELAQGDLRSGFKRYEFRFRRTKATTRPARPQFAWDGTSPLKGKRFLVYDEQGIGDMFQFVRYLPLLADRGADVRFRTNARFHRILQSPELQVRLVSEMPPDDRIDHEAPLMSLPHLLGTELNTIPAPGPYLLADPERVERWAKVLGEDGFRIGICWQGAISSLDAGRSFPLSLFEGISKISGVRLVSLHRGAGESQLDTVPFDVRRVGADFDAGADAFVDCAAVMMNCDLVITSDTSVAHLAGALGRPTWVALKHVPEWRWLMDRTDSPWYPTMVLYRQQTMADWDSLFARMAEDLRGLVASAGSH